MTISVVDERKAEWAADKFIDYSLLKNSIVNDLENNCQVYDFAISKLENLKFN